MLDTVSRQTVAADRLVDDIMRLVLARSPGATRIRLAIIRGATDGAPSASHAFYDVTNTVAVRGRPIGTTPMNRPMTDWRGFLADLLSGQCTMQALPRTGVAAGRADVASSQLTSSLICPAADATGRLLGAVFILWDGSEEPPAAEALQTLAATAKSAASQIAEVLCLSGHRPLHLLQASPAGVAALV